MNYLYFLSIHFPVCEIEIITSTLESTCCDRVSKAVTQEEPYPLGRIKGSHFVWGPLCASLLSQHRFLNPGTFALLGQTVTCYRVCPVHCRILSITTAPGNQQPPAPVVITRIISRCLLGDKSLPVFSLSLPL